MDWIVLDLIGQDWIGKDQIALDWKGSDYIGLESIGVDELYQIGVDCIVLEGIGLKGI